MATKLIPICFVVDENIYMFLETVCKSIIKNVSLTIHFCILTNKEENINNIERLMDTFSNKTQYTIKSLTVEHDEYLKSLYIPEQRVDITGFVYSQILFPEYFSNFKKILFLEPDQIVKSDLAMLWNEIMEKDINLGAVNYKNGSNTLNTLAKLYPERQNKGYNAGVMIVDTEFWIKNNFTTLCFDVIIKQKESNGKYYDYYAEGAINIALQTHIYELDSIYNTVNLGWNPDIPKHILDKAVILHWNGNSKPWKENGLYRSYYVI